MSGAAEPLTPLTAESAWLDLRPRRSRRGSTHRTAAASVPAAPGPPSPGTTYSPAGRRPDVSRTYEQWWVGNYQGAGPAERVTFFQHDEMNRTVLILGVVTPIQPDACVHRDIPGVIESWEG